MRHFKKRQSANDSLPTRLGHEQNIDRVLREGSEPLRGHQRLYTEHAGQQLAVGGAAGVFILAPVIVDHRPHSYTIDEQFPKHLSRLHRVAAHQLCPLREAGSDFAPKRVAGADEQLVTSAQAIDVLQLRQDAPAAFFGRAERVHE